MYDDDTWICGNYGIHLPTFECSNFNSSLVSGVEDDVLYNQVLSQTDVNVYGKYVDVLNINRILLSPDEFTIENVQKTYDDVVGYVDIAINQLPTLGVDYTAKVCCYTYS